MVYYHPIRRNWFFPPYLYGRDGEHIDAYFPCFLKEMCEKSLDGTWQYKFFDESEWRIIYSESIEETLKKLGKHQIVKLFKKPGDIDDDEFKNYLAEIDENKRPEYLIPLDAWFSMIIYPSLAVKIASDNDPEIRSLIKEIKKKSTPGCTSEECKNMPIESDLDACRNF